MPASRKRKRKPGERETSRHPLSPTPTPDEGVNPRLEDDADRTPKDDESRENPAGSEDEQEARNSESAFDRAVTRFPPD